MKKLFISSPMVIFLLALSLGTVHAQDGVTAQEIKIGMANALTGPAADLGIELKSGATAYFDKVNAAGGIHGRKITLVSLDDGYEPEKTAATTKKLIQAEKVFALFGYVGTPTSTAAIPIATQNGVPFLFPFTGAEFLRNPVNKYVFNLRTSYFDETETMVDRLTKDVGAKKIALFIQDDAFGEAGKAGITRAMMKRNLKVSAEVRYKRNTLDIEEGLAKLKADKPEAIVFIGTYKPFAKLVKTARKEGVQSRFLTVSFIGTAAFMKEAGTDGNGVIITQVMPSPQNSNVPLVEQYLKDYKRSAATYGSLEGYANAQVLASALKKTGKDLTRENLMETLEQLNTNIGGLQVEYSAQDHQGLSKVYITQVKDGKAIEINKL